MRLRPTRKPVRAILRRGQNRDLDALVAMERAFFTADHRISRRGFRHFIASPTPALLVAEIGGEAAGCALVLYRRGSRIARLYTIAVGQPFRGRGLARRLLAAAEADAIGRRRRVMRLEVRADDAGAIALYETSGYRPFGRRRRYYDNRIDALRFDKPLGPATASRSPRRRASR